MRQLLGSRKCKTAGWVVPGTLVVNELRIMQILNAYEFLLLSHDPWEWWLLDIIMRFSTPRFSTIQLSSTLAILTCDLHMMPNLSIKTTCKSTKYWSQSVGIYLIQLVFNIGSNGQMNLHWWPTVLGITCLEGPS